jgi:RHS repeat-associated protein
MEQEGRVRAGYLLSVRNVGLNSAWSLTETINYMYDGMMVIQMRGSTTSSYTRGLDISGSLQGAGGIGGLLAQTVSGAHAYYHSDANGNVTYLMRADQSLGASYRYDDAYGNVLTGGGTLSNPFRFSSKEWMLRISAYYYGYRFYYPSIQRWLNRDPLGELGFEMLRDGQTDLIGDDPNLYAYVKNNPENQTDSLGLASSGSATLVTEPTLLMSEEAAKAYAAKQCRCAALKLATQAAKKAASSLGGCKGTDSCDVLLAKSLAWLALAGARTAENSICFDGGNPGHKRH